MLQRVVWLGGTVGTKILTNISFTSPGSHPCKYSCFKTILSDFLYELFACVWYSIFYILKEKVSNELFYLISSIALHLLVLTVLYIQELADYSYYLHEDAGKLSAAVSSHMTEFLQPFPMDPIDCNLDSKGDGTFYDCEWWLVPELRSIFFLYLRP